MPSFWKGKFLGVNFMCGHFCVQEFCSWRSKKTHGWEHHVQPFVWLLVEKKRQKITTTILYLWLAIKKHKKPKIFGINSPLKHPNICKSRHVACFSVAVTWPKPWGNPAPTKWRGLLVLWLRKSRKCPVKQVVSMLRIPRIHPSMVQMVSQLFSGGFWMVFWHPLEKCEKQSAETIWWFPKIRATPSHHSFVDGFSVK